MSHTLHRLARTTPKTRAEIRALREAGLTPRGLMKRYRYKETAGGILYG
ncbi:MAG: hypothetical protein LBP86_02940 [Azoarcus sp.]|jgi:hypothetical protein|nr:hypothetical protein [Azoarcus sp.]